MVRALSCGLKRSPERLLAAVIGAVLMCGTATAQESTLPPDPVAQVGPVAISAEEFEHWFAQAAHSHFGRPMELVGPAYERCVAAKRWKRVTKHWSGLNEPALRERCARDHRSLRRMVVRFLVQAQWIQQEATRQGVEVSDRRVNRLFERQRRTAFPERGGYERFLRESGASEDGIRYRIRLDALQNRLTRRIAARVRPVTAVGQQRALQRFIEGFRKRYMAVTWCAAGYEIGECGATAPPPIPAGPPK